MQLTIKSSNNLSFCAIGVQQARLTFGKTFIHHVGSHPEGEGILENARDFAAKQLQKYLKQKKLDEYLSMLVDHALELPLHWRVLRLEAKLFIDVYERSKKRNPILLELAKLDFNIVQAMHQSDLINASK
ncbi:hypothetical protein CRYUN_Cryun17cG0078800 [Craigia yunnanensis]